MLYIQSGFEKKLDGNGRSACGALDASIISKRKLKKKEWMLKLRTVFSYGLNDQLRDDFVKEETYVLVGFKFSAVSRIFTRISRMHVYKLNTSFSPDVFFKQF